MILEELSHIPLNDSHFIQSASVRAQAETLYNHLQYRANGNVSCVEGIRLMYEQPAPPPPNPVNRAAQQSQSTTEQQDALEVSAPFDSLDEPEDAEHFEDTEEETLPIASNLPPASDPPIQIVPSLAAPPAEHVEECAICLGEELSNPVQLSCKHEVFDLHCIFEWYLKVKTCPLARCPITEIHSVQKISPDLITLNLTFSNAPSVKLNAHPNMTIRHLKTLLKTINVQIFAHSENPVYLDNDTLKLLPSASDVKDKPRFYFWGPHKRLGRVYLPSRSKLSQLGFTPSNTYNIEATLSY